MTRSPVHAVRLWPGETLFVEANPGPCKYAMQEMGMCNEMVRLPLVTMGDANKEKVKTLLTKMGFLA